MQLIELGKLNAADMLGGFLSPRRRSVGNLTVVDYLSDVSRKILGSKACRQHPDVITFGYFCRKSSIKRALENTTVQSHSFGWGFALHIAPSNVPVNFAFSFVFGLLAGNNNLVRLPTTSWPQVELLIGVFREVAKLDKYKDLSSTNAFVRTERDSPELNKMVSHCDALVVWGGDTTVATFRSLSKKPRCVELYFPDRKSSLVINAQTLADYSEDQFDRLALDFFNDTYLVDNNACSSPRRIYWVGDDVNLDTLKNRFWQAVDKVITRKEYNLNIVAKIDRYLDVMRSVELAKSPVKVNKISEDIWLTSRGDEMLIGRLGRYSEASFCKLGHALAMLDDDEQTLTYMGFDQEQMKNAILNSGVIVDRVVPAGIALDISFLWDGVDVLQRLSRTVDFR